MSNLKFKNGKFRILQLTDLQDTQKTSPDTINLIYELIDKSKPDLIVLTGDQVKGYGFNFAIGDNKTNAAMTISNLMKPIADSKIPFTVVFGNHDSFGTADKDFQWSCYNLYDNFIGKDYTFDSIPVYSEKSDDVKFCIYMFDSHEKNKNGKYIPITDEQLNSYKKVRDNFINKYGHIVHALAFQHIPPEDIYDCFESSNKKFYKSIQGAGIHSSKYYRLPLYAENKSSFMGENAASPDERGDQVKTLKEKGDVLGLYFGHDHNNSFIVKHGNLDLGYTQGCGFNIYGPGKNRGGRVFDIYEENTDRYDTFTITSNDIDNFKIERPIKSFIYTHSPSSVSQAIKVAKKVGVATAFAASVAIAIVKANKKK